MRSSLTSLSLVLLTMLGAPAVAQQPTQTEAHAARVANEVSHEVMSPFCPGKTLAMCPSPAAAEVRMQIQDMASSGMETDAIKNAIIEEHGEEFRIVEPPWTDNVGLLGALGGGLALAFVAVLAITRRGRKDGDAPEQPAKPADDEGGDPYLEELRSQYRD